MWSPFSSFGSEVSSDEDIYMEDEYNNYGTNDSGEVVTTPNNSRDVDSDTSRSAKDITVISLSEGEICFGCGQIIAERYILKVSGRAYHTTCLRCSVCQTALDRHTSCYIKEDSVFCKTDYSREFGTKCAKCCRPIQSTDWVRRAKDNVYHLACFSCDACKRQLSTGEEFALQEDRVLCKTHYIELIEGGTNGEDGGSQKPKTKRVRTTFTEEQVQVLQANFQLDSNPDGQDLERIAQITGLSKRVTQVWFQNSRARQKKNQQMSHHQKHNNLLNNMSSLVKNLNSSPQSCGPVTMTTYTSSTSPTPSCDSSDQCYPHHVDELETGYRVYSLMAITTYNGHTVCYGCLQDCPPWHSWQSLDSSPGCHDGLVYS